jgi:hypothetical protein
MKKTMAAMPVMGFAVSGKANASGSADGTAPAAANSAKSWLSNPRFQNK